LSNQNNFHLLFSLFFLAKKAKINTILSLILGLLNNLKFKTSTMSEENQENDEILENSQES